jgi:hypothetical protein
MALTSSSSKPPISLKTTITYDQDNGNTEPQTTNNKTDDEKMDIEHTIDTNKNIKNDDNSSPNTNIANKHDKYDKNINITDYDDTPTKTENDKNDNTNTNYILILDINITHPDTCIKLNEPTTINNVPDNDITFHFNDEKIIDDPQSQYGLLLKNFLDKYNAKMEAFGNYLAFTTNDIDDKMNQAIQSIDDKLLITNDMVNHIQDQLQSFTSTYEQSFTKASAQLQSIIDKFSYFKGTHVTKLGLHCLIRALWKFQGRLFYLLLL